MPHWWRCRCTNTQTHTFMFSDERPEAIKGCFMWALSFINIFYWVEQIADLLWYNEKSGPLRTNSSFGSGDWHPSQLFNSWFTACLFSRWQHLIQRSVSQHFSSFFSSVLFFQILVWSSSVVIDTVYSHCSLAGLNLGYWIFKWQSKGVISEHDPQFKLPFITSSLGVGTNSRVL